MAERYSKLFALDSCLYAPEVPVLVAAGVLLKDSYSTNLLAQIKYINIGQEPVSSLKVLIKMLDEGGLPLSKPVEYQYLDVNAPRDAEFGRNVAIVLPNRNARSFQVEITEICYASGKSWSAGEDTKWVPVKRRQTLEEALGGKDMAQQYQVRYGNDCKYSPLELDVGLWYCTCGTVNQASEQKCHKCRRALSALKTVNLDTLRSECAERLKVEEVQAAEEKAESQEKNKKLLTAVGVIVPVLLVLILLLIFVPPRIAVMRDYMQAAALLSAGEFDQAAEAFTALGDYRDSAEQAEKNVPYERAKYIVSLAEAGEEDSLSFIGKRGAELPEAEYGEHAVSVLFYQAALEIFNSLGDYRESAEQARLCQDAIAGFRLEKLQSEYDAAMALLDELNYSQAHDAFLALGDFKDSADMALEAAYRKGVALYGFTEKYKVRYVYASLSVQAGAVSVFSVSTDRAVEIGSEAIGELRAACGKDGCNILLDEPPTSEQQPMLDSLIALFEFLGNYKDSAQYIEKLQIAGDYTRPFFQLCENGDVYGAYDWLMAYEEEFPDRDRWLELLELYKPFCDSWVLNSGDPTLIPMTVGQEAPLRYFNTGVTVSLNNIILHIRTAEDPEYVVDLHADPGETSFVNDGDGYNRYYANISVVDRLAYMKYNIEGGMTGSCDYSRN